MSKSLDLIGFALIGVMVYAFAGLVSQKDPAGWPIFWACAVGALAIIIYKKRLKKKGEPPAGRP